MGKKQQDSSSTAAQGLKIDRKTLITILILLAGVMVLAGVLTQVIPRGTYSMDENGSIINGTYSQNPDYRMPLWKILASPILIFTQGYAVTGIAIILFIVLIGGTFLILEKSKVLQYIMSVVVKKYENRKYLLLAMVVLLFMGLASVIGILEESIILVPLAVAISLALGWDSFVGIGMSLVAIAFGYTAATFNPFNVMVVQMLAGLPVFSGLWFRLIVFVLVYAVLVGFLILYAKKIEKNPKASLAYESDKEVRQKYQQGIDESLLANPALKKATKTFIYCVLGVFVAVIISFVLRNSAAIPESLQEYIGYLPTAAMAILFTTGGLLAGRIAGIRGKALLSGFWQGVKTIAPALPLILLVICVTYILQEGQIVHTLLYWVYGAIKNLHPGGALLVIFAFVMLLEFFIGSGTAKAFLIMPIVLPLAQLVGLTEQSIVLAFTLSDGFCNIVYPTSGIMIIAIGLVGITYGKYLKWFWKLFLAEMALSIGIMLTAVAIGYA